MLSRLRKMLTFVTHALFLYIVWYSVSRHTGYSVGTICLTLGSTLVVATLPQFIFLLRTYSNIFSRLQMRTDIILGIPLAAAAVYFGPDLLVRAGGIASIVAWVVMYYEWRKRAAVFEKQGTGPLRADTWVNVDAEAIKAGDMILTSGRMAALMRQSVGHTEICIPYEGRLVLFSSWFETGACINEVARICKPSDRNHYIVRRPVTPWTLTQLIAAEAVANVMLEQNRAAAERIRLRRERMPRMICDFFNRKWAPTGYDWKGIYNGKRRFDRWTCSGIFLEVCWRIGVDIGNEQLGAGIAGLNTGWLDPLNAEDLRGLKTWRTLTHSDRALFECEQRAAEQCAAPTTTGETIEVAPVVAQDVPSA